MVEIEGKGKLHISYSERKPRASMEWGDRGRGGKKLKEISGGRNRSHG